MQLSMQLSYAGGFKESAAQVVAYEIPLGISLLVPLMVARSFNLIDVSEAQAGMLGMNWFIWPWVNPFMLPAFIILFVAVLAVTAVTVSVANQQYQYDQGQFYEKSGDGYTAVPAPVGATVEEIPSSSQTVVVNETTNNYYYGGTYFEKSEGGYTVVPPTAM